MASSDSGDCSSGGSGSVQQPPPNILAALVRVSEKAARIARSFRQDEHLFALLVQEKTAEEGANAGRFVHDYKTLADVLIQETIRHDIGAAVSILRCPKSTSFSTTYDTF